MENKKWLPSDTRNRLIDLCKDRNISQAQLAGVIGIDRSALSRFLSGKTDSMSHEHVIAIAKYFNVSTDFLLGETDDPGRINYDIGELGLTVKAAECLYTRKVDPDILCRLLEQERCGELMHEIAKACPHVSDVELFDIYRGEQIGEGHKSMAFKICFSPDDKPLAPEDVDRFVKKILGNLKYRLGAEIR